MTIWVHAHPLDRLFFDDWNFCGCGNPEDMLKHIGNVLNLHKTVSDITEGDWNTQWDARQKLLQGANGLLMLYWLDAQGLTEHGGSVYGGWMTDKGKQVLALIEAHLTTFDQQENMGLIEVQEQLPLEAFLTEATQ